MSFPVPTGRLRPSGLAVHALTASGAGLAWLALTDAIEDRFSGCFGWLALALLVDGLDGAIARSLRVEETAARFDGALLDLVVDFLTYVLVPVVVLWRADLLPAPIASGFAFVILVTTALYFADTQMKTADHWFRGFPGCWNVVVFGLVALRPPAAMTAALLIVFTVLMFVPVRFIHPFRVRRWRGLSILAGAVGAVASGALLIDDFAPATWPRWALGVAMAYFTLAGLLPGRAREG